MLGCHNCTKERNPQNCESCTRVNFDDVTIAHSLKVEGEPSTVAFANVPTPWLKTIPRETQRALIDFLLRFKDLTIREWLLIWHVWHHGTPRGFIFAKKSRAYEIWHDVAGKIPEIAHFAPLVGTVAKNKRFRQAGRNRAEVSRDGGNP